jgi:hypothetical protein
MRRTIPVAFISITSEISNLSRVRGRGGEARQIWQSYSLQFLPPYSFFPLFATGRLPGGCTGTEYFLKAAERSSKISLFAKADGIARFALNLCPENGIIKAIFPREHLSAARRILSLKRA